MPNPYQLVAAAIQELKDMRTSLPPSVSLTLGFDDLNGDPRVPPRPAVPNPGAVTRQGAAAGNVLALMFDTILFGSTKPPVQVATLAPLGGGSAFVPGSVVSPDRFVDVPDTQRGVTLGVDDAVLVNGQANLVQNGHYTVIASSAGLLTLERTVGCQNGDLVFAGSQVWDAENKVLYYLDGTSGLFQFTFGTDPLLWRVLDVLNVAGTKTPTRAATTADLGAVYDPNPIEGFTGAPAVVDGVALADGDRVLVKDQAIPIQNGVYDVLDAAGGTWERAADCRGFVDGGTLITAQAGTANGDVVFVLNEDGTLQFGVDAITFMAYPAVATGVDAENAGVPIGGGPFTTLNLASGISGVDAGGGTLDITVPPPTLYAQQVFVLGAGATGLIIDNSDVMVSVTVTGINATIQLPAAPTVGRLIYVKIKDASTNSVIFDPNGNPVDGSALPFPLSPGDALTLFFDGGEWDIR